MRNNHDKKNYKLVKRTFALCLALAVICSCLLPVFATGDGISVMLPDTDVAVQPGGEIAMPVIPGDGADDSGAADSGSTGSTGTPVTDPSSVAGVTFPEGATNIVKNPNGSYSYDTAYGRITVFPDADKVDMSDVTVKPNPNLKQDDAAFGVLPIEYHFWLKKMDSFDLDDLAWEAEMANLSETEYLSLYGSSKEFPIWHMDTISADDVMGNYTFANPTSLNDPEGQGREFAGWYIVDSLGVESEFEFYKSYGDESNIVINVYAKWKDASGDVVEEPEQPKTDDGKSEETKDDTKQEESKDETRKNETAKAALSAEAALPDTDAKATVTVEGMPANATHLSVTAMGDSSMENFYNLYTELGGKLMPMLGFKITPKDAGGNTVQPNGYVTVTISGLGDLGLESLSGIKVLHQTADNKIETLDALYDSATGTLTFLTNSFSPFVIAYPAESGVETLKLATPIDKISGKAGSTLKLTSDAANHNNCKWSVTGSANATITSSANNSATLSITANIANDTDLTVTHSYTIGNTTYKEVRTVRVTGTSSSQSGYWVYVYVRVKDATAADQKRLGLEALNADGWFTVGKVFVNGITDPSDKSVTHAAYITDTGDSNFSLLVGSDGKLKSSILSSIERYEKNSTVALENIRFTDPDKKNDCGLVMGDGAADYVMSHRDKYDARLETQAQGINPTWHLDGYLDAKQTGSVVIHYMVSDDGGNYTEHTQKNVLGKLNETVTAQDHKLDSIVTDDGKVYEFEKYGNPVEVKVTAEQQNLYIYYVRKTADLTVSKTVTGLLGDHHQQFTFQIADKAGNPVALTAANFEIVTGDNTQVTLPNGGTDGKFTLVSGASVTIKNLAGDYIVKELDATGYTTSWNLGNAANDTDGADASVTMSGTNQTLVFTNHRSIIPDTGVLLDTLPYIVILAVVVGGGVLLVLRKRRKDDED